MYLCNVPNTHRKMAAKRNQWSDEYWLLLMQLYLRKPVGVKPLYSRGLVNLALELHVQPRLLYEQMFRLRQLDTPQLERLWAKYAKSPQRLARGVKLLRQMKGFGQAGMFYDGVEENETFERDFRPMEGHPHLKPAMLILVLDLYFRLTPNTMVPETPEIIELAKKMKIKPEEVVELMECYQHCDPYLKRNAPADHPLMAACEQTWKRFGNDSPEKLAALAAQMVEYFKVGSIN